MRKITISINFLLVLLCFFLCVKILRMAEPTWDSLAKNQTDPTLITEYIATAIANHESDPTAHLADAKSLGLHRTNEVLDHPAGSVLADKATLSEITSKNNMQSGEGWQATNMSGVWPQAYAAFTHNGFTVCDYENDNIYWLDKGDFNLPDALFTIGFIMSGDVNTYADVAFGMGAVDFPTSDFAVGGVIHNGSLKFLTSWGGTPVYSSGFSLTFGKSYLFTARLSSVDNMVYFYINGTMVYSVTVPTLTDWSFAYFKIHATRNSNPVSPHLLQYGFGPLTMATTVY